MLRLLSTAAQAEGILLRRQGATVARQVVLGIVAGLFGLAALALLHVAGFLWLEERYGALHAILLLALVDAVLALVLVLMARGGRDKVAEDARQLRQQSLALLAAPSAARFPWESIALDVGGMLLTHLRRRR